MGESFDSFRYISYLRLRWRQIAASAAVAVALAFAISLAMPARYTAMARIVIQPPVGADVRTATAVSPIYLESLKTYQRNSRRAIACSRRRYSDFILAADRSRL
jgi:uncharacterized protein involved in exopolysaccharide biosynthesis